VRVRVKEFSTASIEFNVVASQNRILKEVLNGLRDGPEILKGRSAIWVADDNADVRLLLGRAFQRCQVKIETEFFGDGAAVVKRLVEGGSAPRVLLLDIQMPWMDGMAVLRTLRREGYLEWTVVIVCSSLDDAVTVQEAYAFGVQFYVRKPRSGEEYKDIARLCAAAASLDPIRARPNGADLSAPLEPKRAAELVGGV
jgi:CheY-like chemotaxis protein